MAARHDGAPRAGFGRLGPREGRCELMMTCALLGIYSSHLERSASSRVPPGGVSCVVGSRVCHCQSGSMSAGPALRRKAGAVCRNSITLGKPALRFASILHSFVVRTHFSGDSINYSI